MRSTGVAVLAACQAASEPPSSSAHAGDGAIAATTAVDTHPSAAEDHAVPATKTDRRGARTGPSAPAIVSVPSAVSWFEGDLEGALAAARESGRKVFVDVGAYWCPPCQMLEEEVFSDPDFARGLEKLAVPMHVDIEIGDGAALAERFAVAAYPTMLMLDENGNELGRVVDAHAKDELLVALAHAARGEDPLANLRQRAAQAPSDLEAALALADAAASAADVATARAEYARVIAGDPADESGLRSRAELGMAMSVEFKSERDLAAAERRLRALIRDFAASKAAFRAHRQLARVLKSDGRDEEALVALEGLLVPDPVGVDAVSNFVWFCFRERFATERALEVVRAGLIAHPDQSELHYLESELCLDLGRLDEALAAIDRAIAAEPKRSFYARQRERIVTARSQATQ